MKSKLILSILSLLIIISINACTPSADASTSGTYSIDPTFSDFYRGFGGASTLGPAISPSFLNDGITYQYLVSGLMVYDPKQVPLKRFHFSPIASIEWKINDLVEPAPINSSQPFMNGHRIWEEVWPFYNRYGADIIGVPLTGVKVNDKKQRYEQYFEGMGFYRNFSDPPGQIKLLPYGYWMCGKNCVYQDSDREPPVASYTRDYSETEQLFLQLSESLGFGFTGSPLAPPNMGADGYFEMVFENVIMYVDAANGNQINLRPLPAWLGVSVDQPSAEIKADWLSFYPADGELGYNVPVIFMDYIAAHGGNIYSGAPITDYRNLPDGGYTQCYTNICLEFHPTAPDMLKIRPKALGVEFQTNGMNLSSSDSSFADALQINVWEQYQLIPSGQRQVINIKTSQKDVPIKGVDFSLVVKQPDGITKTYNLKPTGEDGATSIELDAINGPNGAIVQYEVCVLGAVSPQICFSRSYTIWDQ